MLTSLTLQFCHFHISRAGADSKYPPDATIAAKQFALRDFVIGTATAVYGRVNTDGTDVKVT